jgi:two-component system, NarL family, nitrate/nitrite response regulator NarL
MMDEIRVLVVDDHPLLREGVVSTLNSDQNLTVVGVGGSYDDVMQLAPQLMPDIILLDVSMPGGGVNAAKALHEVIPVIKIIMLTVSEVEKDVMSALKAGASGYILKGVSGKDLIKIVKNIHAGETYITPSLATNLLVDLYESEPPSEDSVLIKELNKKETEILKPEFKS